MKPEILDKYSKTIKELETFYIKTKEIALERSLIKIEDDIIRVIFKDSWTNNIKGLPLVIEFTREEILEISTLFFTIVEKKYQSNLDKAKKDFQQMLIEKL